MSDLTGTKGGSGVWQRIISEMPAHEVYIEAFWGRGTIAAKKKPARCTIGIDLDPDAIKSGRGLGALMFRADGIQWLKDYFRLPSAGDSENGVTAATHDSAFRARALSRLPASLPGASQPTTKPGSDATFCGVSWENHFVYLDPPYLGFKGYYRFELSEEQHIDLCRTFLSLPCPAALSGYRSEVLDAELRDCRSISIPTVNRAGKRVNEIVWMNYDPPSRYHDARFAGLGRRGRERIRRRVKNWREQLKGMSPAERQAIWEACDTVYRDSSRVIATAASAPDSPEST